MYYTQKLPNAFHAVSGRRQKAGEPKDACQHVLKIWQPDNSIMNKLLVCSLHQRWRQCESGCIRKVWSCTRHSSILETAKEKVNKCVVMNMAKKTSGLAMLQGFLAFVPRHPLLMYFLPFQTHQWCTQCVRIANSNMDACLLTADSDSISCLRCMRLGLVIWWCLYSFWLLRQPVKLAFNSAATTQTASCVLDTDRILSVDHSFLLGM